MPEQRSWRLGRIALRFEIYLALGALE